MTRSPHKEMQTQKSVELASFDTRLNKERESDRNIWGQLRKDESYFNEVSLYRFLWALDRHLWWWNVSFLLVHGGHLSLGVFSPAFRRKRGEVGALFCTCLFLAEKSFCGSSIFWGGTVCHPSHTPPLQKVMKRSWPPDDPHKPDAGKQRLLTRPLPLEGTSRPRFPQLKSFPRMQAPASNVLLRPSEWDTRVNPAKASTWKFTIPAGGCRESSRLVRPAPCWWKPPPIGLEGSPPPATSPCTPGFGGPCWRTLTVPARRPAGDTGLSKEESQLGKPEPALELYVRTSPDVCGTWRGHVTSGNPWLDERARARRCAARRWRISRLRGALPAPGPHGSRPRPTRARVGTQSEGELRWRRTVHLAASLRGWDARWESSMVSWRP